MYLISWYNNKVLDPVTCGFYGCGCSRCSLGTVRPLNRMHDIETNDNARRYLSMQNSRVSVLYCNLAGHRFCFMSASCDAHTHCPNWTVCEAFVDDGKATRQTDIASGT